MTPRTCIAQKHRIPPSLALWLQPFFEFDVTTVPITIGKCNAYGEPWHAITKGGKITLDTWYFSTCATSPLLQTLAHELYHVEEYRRQGWLSHLLERIFRPRVKGERYSHAVIPEEHEADQRRHEVAVFLLARQSELPQMDEEMA